MQEKRLEIYLFFILLAIALYFSYEVLLPYLQVLSLALVFAVVFEPLYKKVAKHIKVHESISAIITVLIVSLIILVPLTLYGMALTNEIKDLYQTFFSSTNSSNIIDQLTNNANQFVEHYSWTEVHAPVFNSVDTENYIFSVLAWIRGHFGDIFSGLTKFFISLFLFIVSFYFLLRDGDNLKSAVIKISPFTDNRDEEILNRLKNAVMSVVKGSLLVALVQGILTGVGFYLFNIPSALLWGGVAGVTSLVPGIGTSLVIVPGIIYLFLAGQIGNGIGLAVWGVLSVTFIDNILASYLVGRGAKVHPLLIMLSAIGGIGFFGPLGFIFGPVVISFLFALFDIYKTILVKDALK